MTNASFLRRVLWLDAATCIACGLLLTLGARALEAPLGLPAGLLLGAGLVLFPVAVLLAWIARQPTPPAGWVWFVIAGNLLWAADSLALLFTPWVAPTTLGVVFVAGQALAVIAISGLERAGLRAIRA